MEQQRIPFVETHRFSRLFLDYVAGHEALAPLYSHLPTADGLQAAMATKSQHPIHRELLVSRLRAQYEGMELGEALEANLKALEGPNTFTITTGHQLCLFTGPLYFIYKIVTAINAARKLAAAHPDKHFVPVYWMASEDHDFAEINHAHVFGQRLEWELDAAGPVGWLSTETLSPVLDALEELLGTRPNAPETMALLRNAYSQANLAAATRTLVHQLFGQTGLVIIDGDDAQLKASFAPMMRKELLEQPAEPAVARNTEALQAVGYKGQVSPRNINLFWMEPGVRTRLVRTTSGFEALGHREFSSAELMQALESNPEQFSPNVVLRPLYQEFLLPNLAYVGGPGELAYWFQLKGVFDAFEVPFPVLLPRNFVMLLDGGVQKKLAKLEMEPQQLFGELEQLKKDYVNRHADNGLSLDAEKQQLSAMYADIRTRAMAIDQTLKGAVEGEEQRQLKALEGLEKRLLKAEKQRHETALRQLEGIVHKLFPNNGLQERHDNVLPYLLRYGTDFIDQLLEALDPLELEMVLLKEA